MPRRSREDLLFDVLARLFNTWLGALIALDACDGSRPRLTMYLLSVDEPTALAILCGAGALVGLLWGKSIWAAIDRSFHGGWAPKGEPGATQAEDETPRRKRKTP